MFRIMKGKIPRKDPHTQAPPKLTGSMDFASTPMKANPEELAVQE